MRWVTPLLLLSKLIHKCWRRTQKSVSCIFPFLKAQWFYTMSSYRTKSDLPQGGLEIPCVYAFTGVSAQINKVKKLLTDHATIPEAKNTADTYGDDEIDLTDVDETVKKEKNRRYIRDTLNNGYY